MRIIDQPAFRNLIYFCRPTLTEKDIPHRTKLRKEIIEQAKVVENQVKKNLQVSVRGHYVVCISFTYLVRYCIILPIPPRHTGYLWVDLISVVL